MATYFSVFLLSANNIEMNFCPSMVKKSKNQLFEENKSCECSFYRIEVQVITNLSNRLEKNTHQILEDLLMTNFYDLKKTTLIFRIF